MVFLSCVVCSYKLCYAPFISSTGLSQCQLMLYNKIKTNRKPNYIPFNLSLLPAGKWQAVREKIGRDTPRYDVYPLDKHSSLNNWKLRISNVTRREGVTFFHRIILRMKDRQTCGGVKWLKKWLDEMTMKSRHDQL